MRYLPTIFRFGYGLGLAAICLAYRILFPGPLTSSAVVPTADRPLPSYVPSVLIAAIVMMVAATLAEFIPNRVGMVLSVLGASVGVACVFLFLLPGLIYGPGDLPAAFYAENVKDTLPWAMTTASVFVAMLPRRTRKEE